MLPPYFHIFPRVCSKLFHLYIYIYNCLGGAILQNHELPNEMLETIAQKHMITDSCGSKPGHPTAILRSCGTKLGPPKRVYDS